MNVNELIAFLVVAPVLSFVYLTLGLAWADKKGVQLRTAMLYATLCLVAAIGATGGILVSDMSASTMLVTSLLPSLGGCAILWLLINKYASATAQPARP